MVVTTALRALEPEEEEIQPFLETASEVEQLESRNNSAHPSSLTSVFGWRNWGKIQPKWELDSVSPIIMQREEGTDQRANRKKTNAVKVKLKTEGKVRSPIVLWVLYPKHNGGLLKGFKQKVYDWICLKSLLNLLLKFFSYSTWA